MDKQNLFHFCSWITATPVETLNRSCIHRCVETLVNSLTVLWHYLKVSSQSFSTYAIIYCWTFVCTTLFPGKAPPRYKLPGLLMSEQYLLLNITKPAWDVFTLRWSRESIWINPSETCAECGWERLSETSRTPARTWSMEASSVFTLLSKTL